MDRIIRLNDGTEYPCEMCGMFDEQLWIHARLGMTDACGVFVDRERIKTITDTYAGDDGALREIIWEGYTELFHLHFSGGITQIGLIKGDGT